MNHIFCTQCGNKIEYSYSKPNFCSKCGNKCGSGFDIGNNNLKTQSSVQIETESLAEDETSVDEVPHIHGGLQVETASYGNNVFTFGDLVGEKSQNTQVRNKGSRSLEDFIDDKRG